MEEITPIAEALKKVSGVDLNLGLAVALTACLNGLGAYLKSSALFPNRFIPFVVIGLATASYPALLDSFKPANWIIGIGIGFVAIGAHQGARTVKDMLPKKDTSESDSQPPQP